MPVERVAFDGLWRCLCPSFDPIFYTKFCASPALPRLRSSPSRQYVAPASRRCYQTSLGRVGDTYYKRAQHENLHASTSDSIKRYRAAYITRLKKRCPWIPQKLFSQEYLDLDLEPIPTTTLYAALREFQVVEGFYFSVISLVRYLILKRGEKPNAVLYESLVRVNVDKHHGSAKVVRDLLKEMDQLKITKPQSLYHGVLDVLAIHPDYILRNQMLAEMKRRWFTPTISATESEIVGLLRDGQHELALFKFEELMKKWFQISPWLYDLIIFNLGEIGHHSEAFMLLQHRVRQKAASKMSPNIWYFLLDVFSRDAFYDGVKFIWQRMVQFGMLNPSDGTALNILNVASRKGDSGLATEVVQELNKRGRKLDMHHFEPLLDAYVFSRDLRQAFEILCLMKKVNVEPEASTTRALYHHLRRNEEARTEAIDILNDLRKEQKIPIAAFNVVLEAMLEQKGAFTTALDFYRNVRRICSVGPDVHTFNLLLRHVHNTKILNFAWAEMEAFGVKPNGNTYNLSIMISARQEHYEPVFQYLESMKSVQGQDWFMSKPAAMAVIRRCMIAEDSRVADVIQECKSRGMELDAEVSKMYRKVQELKARQEAGGEAGESDTASRAAQPTATHVGRAPLLQSIGG